MPPSVTRCIILCAGESTRWEKQDGIEKHLVTIDSEVLLDRTIRQLRQNGFSDVVIVANSDDYNRKNATRVAVNATPTRTRADKFLSSQHLWKETGQTLILFGDVWFSDSAMHHITTRHAEEIVFFGRAGNSEYTGCKWRELFAISFSNSQIRRLSDALGELAMEEAEILLPPAGWWLHYYLNATSILGGKYQPLFIQIDDFTEDFDSQLDLARWRKNLEMATLNSLMPASYIPPKSNAVTIRKIARIIAYAALTASIILVTLLISYKF